MDAANQDVQMAGTESGNALPAGASEILSNVEQSIPACFEQVANLHEERIAISSDAWKPVYSELNAMANFLARALVSRGGAPGDRVAILMRHDGPQIVAVLAVLKAARVVVVLNPTDPPVRLR